MKVLLVKLSSLGDVIHTLPVVQDLRRALPHVRIDWVVERGFAPLLAAHPGVDRVVACQLRSWRRAPLSARTRQEWRAFKAELQAQPYDAVIDLQGLTKSAWVARLAQLAPGGCRFAMAHRTEGSAYEAPTRWLADVAIDLPAHVHAVHRGRLLCARALGHELVEPVDYGLGKARSEGGPVLLVHGTSRADKQWPHSHWIDLGRRLLSEGHSVALVHGSAAEEATSEQLALGLASHKDAPGRVNVWPRMALDALCSAMADCAGVVGVDSGLSHLAVALNLPHVQLYNFDTAWRTGPPEPGTPGARPWQCSVYSRPTPSVDAVWQAWQTAWQARPLLVPAGAPESA